MSDLKVSDLAETDDEPESEKDQKIADLERRIVKLEDRRREERFAWVFVIILLVDVHVFPQMETWGAPVALLTLQVIFLIFLGKKCGVEDIDVLTHKLIDSWGGNRKQDDS